MIIAKKYLVLAALLACSSLLFSQTPVVAPLDHNPALYNRKTTALNSEPLAKVKSGTQADTLSLPFFDDFSYYSRSSKPDGKLWMDQYVFINNNYPVLPPSNGVATFDALDADGQIYQNTASTFPADTLSSCPINLGVNGLKNVYLSFFYQPGGYGDCPDPGDSLILQFKSPVTENWRTVWHVPGTNMHPFKQVLLPVEDTYLYKGFQFRFVNYVSLDQDKFNLGRKSDADHWHVDYVYLNSNRSETDTAYYDVAVTAPMKSLVKGYQSIPWDQIFDASFTQREPTIEITYRNNNNISHFPSRSFIITDLYNNISNPIGITGTFEIKADEIMTFSQELPYPFESVSVDSALFEIKGYLGTDDYDRKENDTVRFFQFFKNYFARDDGTPESGYGFSGYKAQDCAIACRYETFKADSLQAIQIYFNPTANHVTGKYRFKIAVWRDDNGRPGERVYLSSAEYSPKTTGQFTQYTLDKAVYVTQFRRYWIGWVQVTSGFLNVGFDRNYNDKGNLWYNNGTWKQDVNDGTLMIRPVFGKRKDFPSSAEHPETVADSRMKIYPNPASQLIRIVLETQQPVLSQDYLVEIYDISGRTHYRAPYTGNDIDVSGLKPGFYIVQLIHRKTGISKNQKLIIE